MTDQSRLIAKTLIAHLRSSKQLGLLGDIVAELTQTSEYKNSKNQVVVTSATALDQSELKKIKTYLGNTLEGSYELVETVDPSLVGGFTLQINDTLIDASVLGKINTVSNILTAKE